MSRCASVRHALWVTVLLVVSACGGARAPIEVSDQATPMRYPETEFRVVMRGDTLFSIAWESGRDYRELAAWNRIPSPYRIHPGQKLRLFPPPEPAKPPPPRVAASPPRASTTPPRATRPPPTPKTESVTPKSPATPRAPTSAGARIGAWAWPARGKLLASGGGGLDIAAVRGQPVVAAADGRVVYQGSGLRGYGQLIIIKHNDEFLSAYAHNDRILVKEGANVRRGQKIAEMGSTGTDQVKLHFEIRRNGVPVDPQKYLPKY